MANLRRLIHTAAFAHTFERMTATLAKGLAVMSMDDAFQRGREQRQTRAAARRTALAETGPVVRALLPLVRRVLVAGRGEEALTWRRACAPWRHT